MDVPSFDELPGKKLARLEFNFIPVMRTSVELDQILVAGSNECWRPFFSEFALKIDKLAK